MVSQYRPSYAAQTGGLMLIDEEDNTSVVMEIIKSLGKKILNGEFTDILKVSRPASISSHLTYLQCCAVDFAYTEFLDQAAATSDPIRRLQLVMTFFMGGIGVNPITMKNKPPLNPILGETYSMEKEDGTRIWLEQICHHPPISYWQMIGPNNSYEYTGHGTLVAGLSGPNTLHAGKQGRNTIKFADGGIIEYNTPDMEIYGLVYGQRTVNYVGKCVIKDPINMLMLEINFETDQRSMVGRVASAVSWGWFGSSQQQLPSDFYQVQYKQAVVYQYSDQSDQKVELKRGVGSWLEYIDFSGDMMWNIDMAPQLPWKDPAFYLPSDSRNREDSQAIQQGDIPTAQMQHKHSEKDRLENLQRQDRNLRAQHSR